MRTFNENMKAAAFRRGGFLLSVLVVVTLFLMPAGAADDTALRLSAADREEIVQLFVLANVEFTILHEFGNALIHRFSVPVFGLEEDAADQIATTTMILKHGTDVDVEAINQLQCLRSGCRSGSRKPLKSEAHTPFETVIHWPSNVSTT